ncbi:hypothetical protein [Nocardioides sp. W7]|uniref:hypothetical protein n=1 Tax=Nocardioides sp. W7 TaxID=2931390 RepID=UPI001FD62066|nr:hypothetical protein [Nocardioides sp. W7]
MTERVRVTGPPRRRTTVRSRARDIDTDTELGGIYLGSLLREQLRLAAQVLAVLAVSVGSWPLVFHLWPGLATVELAGVPVAWLVLGVLVYPLLLGLGWWFVRRAERIEHDFTELMEEVEK